VNRTYRRLFSEPAFSSESRSRLCFIQKAQQLCFGGLEILETEVEIRAYPISFSDIFVHAKTLFTAQVHNKEQPTCVVNVQPHFA